MLLHCLTYIWVIDEAPDPADEFIRIIGAEQSFLPVFHEIDIAADRGADDRQGTAHGFKQCHRKSFLQGHEDKEIRSAAEIRDITPVAEEAHLILDSQCFCQFLQFAFQCTAAAEQIVQSGIYRFVLHLCDGFEDNAVILAFDQFTDGQKHNLILNAEFPAQAFPGFRGKLQMFRIDANPGNEHGFFACICSWAKA